MIIISCRFFVVKYKQAKTRVFNGLAYSSEKKV